MYDELVRRLRDNEHEIDCSLCDRDCCYPDGKFHGKCIIIEAADAIEELSKRETPMRVRITTSTKRCPSCNKQVSGRGNIHGNYRYCRWCGQALDWTEPPKEET